MEKEEKEKKKRHIFSKIIIFIILLVIGIVLYARFLGTKGLIIKEYSVKSEIIPSNYNGVKIVQFSDLLFSNNIDENVLELLVENINKVKPDIVIFSGNLSYGIKNFNESNKNLLISYFEKIESTYGNYYITGQEDEKNSTYDEIMSTSFISLDENNENIYSENLDYINLYTLNEDYQIEDGIYNILVLNDTSKIDIELEKEIKPNLILASGSLNGSVIIPYYGPLFIEDEYKDYYAPYYKKADTEIYVSSGIGTKSFNFRLFNKPSINFYRLKSLQ